MVNLLPFRPKPPVEAKPATVSDALQTIALQLLPIFQARKRILTDATLSAQERGQRLQSLDRQARLQGLPKFTELLARVCASRPQVYSNGHPIDCEEFASQVTLLTLDRIVDYNPEAARFSTWLSRSILPHVYSAMQRQVNPAWGRPAPKTERGEAQRQQVNQLARSYSLDQPLAGTERTSLAEVTPDRRPSAEAHLLEGQCRDCFLSAIDRLQESERVLLKRVYVHEESQKQIAASLGITSAAISIQLKKVHRKLFELLGTPFQEECADTQFCESLRRSK